MLTTQPAYDNVPYKAKILVLHSFCDDKNTYPHIWPSMQAEGYEIIVFDQRGAGDTSPGNLYGITNEKAVYDDLDRMIEAVIKNYKGHLFLAGVSMVSKPDTNYKFPTNNPSGRRHSS